jgi:hypothetical protein
MEDNIAVTIPEALTQRFSEAAQSDSQRSAIIIGLYP